jgi:hypothetical protein
MGNVASALGQFAAGEFEGHLDPETNKFDYDVLKTSFPEGVKPDCKEAYLSDAEYSQIIGMGRDEFAALKPWK